MTRRDVETEFADTAECPHCGSDVEVTVTARGTLVESSTWHPYGERIVQEFHVDLEDVTILVEPTFTLREVDRQRIETKAEDLLCQ